MFQIGNVYWWHQVQKYQSVSDTDELLSATTITTSYVALGFSGLHHTTYCAVTVMLVHGPGPHPPHPPPHRHCLPRSRASWLRWTQPRGGTRREVKAGGERASLPLLCLCGFSSSSCVSSMDGRRVCQGPRWDASPWAPVTASGCLRL